jgi:transposase-like protein
MKRSLSFAAATDRLANIGISLGAVAQRFGVRRETISRWRREGGDFPPPDDWRETLARLAEEKGVDLRELARDLRA